MNEMLSVKLDIKVEFGVWLAWCCSQRVMASFVRYRGQSDIFFAQSSIYEGGLGGNVTGGREYCVYIGYACPTVDGLAVHYRYIYGTLSTNMV